MSDKVKKMLSIVDQIEDVRKSNNFAWMDILRIAIKYAPEEAATIMAKINSHDGEIVRLSRELVQASKEA